MDLQALADQHPLKFVIGFVAYFCTLWLVVSFVLSFVSGWHRLHASFPASDRPLAKRSLTSGTFRYIVGYQNVLWLSSNREGLYLGILFLFRFGHPPIFVPWSEIEVRPEKKFLIFRMRTLILGREDQVPLTLKGKIVTRILNNRESL
jgi:hypothetical protein